MSPWSSAYEHPAPGDLLHADVKKLRNLPAGGGGRFLGRAQGNANRTADGGGARSRHYDPLMRHGFIHVVLDAPSRLAYAEIHDDVRRDWMQLGGVAGWARTPRLVDVRGFGLG